MKVIDLLNKIANGEEVPKKIKYDNKSYFYDREVQDYSDFDKNYVLFSDFLNNSYGLNNCLNDEVEILEEPKGIPEKIKIEQDTPSSNYYIKNEFGTKCALTKHSKIIADKINEICDYLKSKGE